MVKKEEFVCEQDSIKKSESSNEAVKCTREDQVYYVKKYDNDIYILNHIIGKYCFNIFELPKHASEVVTEPNNGKSLAILGFEKHQKIVDYNLLKYEQNQVTYNGVKVNNFFENLVLACLIGDWDVNGNLALISDKNDHYATKFDFDEALHDLGSRKNNFNDFFKYISFVFSQQKTEYTNTQLMLTAAMDTVYKALPMLFLQLESAFDELGEFFTEENLTVNYVEICVFEWGKKLKHPFCQTDLKLPVLLLDQLHNAIYNDLYTRANDMKDLKEYVEQLSSEEYQNHLDFLSGEYCMPYQ